MTHRLAAAIVAASSLVCAAAQATGIAEASLADLRVQLFSLDPSGGNAPSVSFDATGGSLARVIVAPSETAPPVMTSMWGGAAFAAADASGAAGGAASGSARVAGDAFEGGAEVATSASADAPGAQAEATVYLGDGDRYSSFTLSPHAVLVISMTADLSAATGGAPDDYAEASAELELAGSRGDSSQDSLADALTAAGGPLGSAGTLQESLVVSFVNPDDVAIEGTFFGGVDSTAAAAPVPEPASAGLLVAAIAVMGATWAGGAFRGAAPARPRRS